MVRADRAPRDKLRLGTGCAGHRRGAGRARDGTVDPPARLPVRQLRYAPGAQALAIARFAAQALDDCIDRGFRALTGAAAARPAASIVAIEDMVARGGRSFGNRRPAFP